MTRLNILFIPCDQLRSDYLGVHRGPDDLTPSDRRARQARYLFDRAAMSSSRICGSSRMSFYTGRYIRSQRRHLAQLSAAGRRDDPRRWKMIHAKGSGRCRMTCRPTRGAARHWRRSRAGRHHCPADRRVNGWARGQHNRVTISDDEVARRAGGELRRGYVIGFWDQAELDAAWAEGSSGN